MDKNDEKVKLVLNKNSLFIEIENTTLISRLVKGEFVKYNHILPTGFSSSATINKDALLTSVERAAVVAKNDRYSIIKFDISENNLTVSAKSEIGNVNESMAINLSGKDITIAFNGKYVMDFLKSTSEEFININFNSSIDPCVFSPVGNKEYTYLVLPVRINA